MICINCGVEMKNGGVSTGLSWGDKFTLTKEKKGILPATIISNITCVACPKCGEIKLFATNPEKII